MEIFSGAGQDNLRGFINDSRKPGLDRHIHDMLWYASLAASSHNCQPWHVRISGSYEFFVECDPDRLLPAVDPENREAVLSIGAFIENFVTAAADSGYHADVKIVAANNTDRTIARIRLSKAEPVNYPMKRLLKRRTIRSGLKSVKLSPDDIDALTLAAPGKIFYFPLGSDHASCIKKAAVKSFRIQAARDNAMQELAEWVRFRPGEVQEHRDGLSVEGMEISGIAGWFIKKFMGPEDVMKPSFIKKSVQKISQQAGQGAGWIIIACSNESVEALIESGRIFQRIALKAVDMKLGIHPMTQCLEEEYGRKKIAANHDKSLVPQFILRVGYVDRYPEPVSARRPVEWFVSL